MIRTMIVRVEFALEVVADNGLRALVGSLDQDDVDAYVTDEAFGYVSTFLENQGVTVKGPA